MTDFERKLGDKKNINSDRSDPMMELTRLLGRENLPSGNQGKAQDPQFFERQDRQYDAEQGSDFNPYSSNAYSTSGASQPIEEAYAEDDEAVYPGQENLYWSGENAGYDDGYSEKSYVSEAAVSGDHYVDDPNAYQQQTSEAYEGQAFQSDNSVRYGWVEEGQQNNQQEPAFYDENVYASQEQAVDGSYNAGVENERYYNASFSPGGHAGGVGDINDSTTTDETQYWTDASVELAPFDDEQPWQQSLGEAEKFSNEFGVEPSDGIYRNNPNPHLVRDEAVAMDVLPNTGGVKSSDIQLNDSHYAAEPQFVDDLSDNPGITSGHVNGGRDVGLSVGESNVLEDAYFEQSRPIGAVIAPMRMATQAQSFLGYGQAVAVLSSRNVVKEAPLNVNKATATTGYPLGRGNAVESNKSVGSSNSAPIGRGVNPFSSAKVQPKVDKNPIASSNDSDFEDALNDFNLTIKGDGKKRYKRDPNLKTVRPDQNAVPETQSFDLPAVSYGGVDRLDKSHIPLDSEFSDVLAPGLHDAVMSTDSVSNYGSLDVSGGASSQFANVAQAQSGSLPLDDAAGDPSKYNWGASDNSMKNLDQKSGGGKKILLLLVFLAIILAGIGAYYVLFLGNDNNSQPVVIHRDEGAVRVEPEVDSNTSDANRDQSVYNRVENGVAAQEQQSELVDKSEVPVDLDKVDEQAPHANETSLDPNSVEARVLQAAENSLSVHEVPTVTIRDRDNVSGDDINAIIANQQDNVLAAGQFFKEHLQAQGQGSQTMPDEDILAGSALGSHSEDNGSGGADDVALLLDGNDSQQSANHAGGAPLSQVEDNVNEGTQANDSGLASLSANNNGVSPTQLGALPTTSEPNSTGNASDVSPVQSADAGNADVQDRDVQRQPVQAQATLPAGAYYVQIASQPSREAAQQSLVDIKRHAQVNSVIGNRQVVIVAADIPGRGTYYRVRVAANNQAAANQLCDQLKSLQVSCFVGK